MSIINTYSDGVTLPRSDRKILQIIKVKQSWTCSKCNKEIPHGSWCVGSGHRKICLSCSHKFFAEVKDDFSFWVEQVRKLEIDLDINQSKYADENMLANLKHEVK